MRGAVTMDKVIRKHLRKIQQQEEKLLQKNGGTFLKPITGKVEEKIPPELYGKLRQHVFTQLF